MSFREELAKRLNLVQGLKETEELIRSKFKSEAHLLTEVPSYLLDLGGKRVRPILTLLTAQALGVQTPTQPLLDVAAGIELIHMATLLHDDIIDNAPLRRNKPSPLVKFGSSNTLLAGDFLLTRAFSLCARLDRFIIDATEDACIELTEGEILEIPLFERASTLKDVDTIARKKTASLFRLSCLCGAHLSGSTESVTKVCGMFGEELGIAFQMLDDILDVTSDETHLGKAAGTDIRERKPALINVLWLESGSSLAANLKRAAIDPETEAAYIRDSLAELRAGLGKKDSVVEKAKQLATARAEKARGHLRQALAENAKTTGTPSKGAVSASDLLEKLITYVLERTG